MRCHNKNCGVEFEQPERADGKRYLYCSRKCFLEQRKEFIWASTAKERLHQGREKSVDWPAIYYRKEEDCAEDPLLPIEKKYIDYCLSCMPYAPTHDFEDWYDIYTTFGPIDW